MTGINDTELLAALLDSWDRNNRILVNLVRALPAEALQARVMSTSPTVAELFTHIHYVRLVFLSEDLPGIPTAVPEQEWVNEANPDRIAQQLDESARVLREAIGECIREGKATKLHYDHPLLFLQHMIWHEGYHHGQMKLAIKLAGHVLKDEEIGPVTWGVWFRKTQEGG